VDDHAMLVFISAGPLSRLERASKWLAEHQSTIARDVIVRVIVTLIVGGLSLLAAIVFGLFGS
jgi:hypothetical protein